MHKAALLLPFPASGLNEAISSTEPDSVGIPNFVGKR
jgi:hypothetical protein